MKRLHPQRSSLLTAALPLALLLFGCKDNNYYTVEDPDVVDPPAPGIDTDGDGLDDHDEVVGWEIVVDSIGFGPGSLSSQLEPFLVTSDPALVDTDADGVTDLEEFGFKTNPREADTDGDGLSDLDEINIWKTSAVSVDTDSDARGPDPDAGLPPKAELFDGHEITILKTSPSLADTDGDNRTDYEEYDDPLRDPRVADLPQVGLNFEGQVDIRLFVEYAESEGTETEYGSSFSTTVGSSTSKTASTSIAVKKEADKGGFGMISDVAEGASTGGKKGAAMAVGKIVAEVGHAAACDELSDQGIGSAASAPPKFDADDPHAVQDDSMTMNDAIKSQDAGEIFDATGVCAPATPETTTTKTQTLTQESSQSATEQYSQYQRDSRTKTETTSSGSVKVGARIVNQGDFAWEVSDLFVTMLQYQPTPGPDAGAGDGASIGTGAFRTLATLTPTAAESVVLGPGSSSPIIELADEGVNPDIIKQFLSRPDAIFYEPAGFDLTNVEGIDYQFLTENTFARTATVVFDYGGGQMERYQIATNVARHAEDDPDGDFEQGDLAGVTLAEVMEILEIPYTTIVENRDVEVGAGMTLGPVEVLETVRGLGSTYADEADLPQRRLADLYAADPDGKHLGPRLGAPTSFWTLHLSLDEEELVGVPFSEITLNHGDMLRALYVTDRDGDGVYADEEAIHGTVDSAEDLLDNGTWEPVAGGDGIPDSVDSDRDGLTDFLELKHGWRVIVNLDSEEDGSFLPHEDPIPTDGNDVYYWVYSDPTSADADGDGLTDEEEFTLFLDPNNADTDDDTLEDLDDPRPNTPARRLYVSLEATGTGDGASWENAYTDLEAALTEAWDASLDDDALNDVASMWVAAGTYVPLNPLGFVLASENCTILGGFVGDETQLDQRTADPLSTATILSGDINGDDTVVIGDPSYDDNSLYVIQLTGSQLTLDGVVISSGRYGGASVANSATFRNCLFRFNSGNGVTFSSSSEHQVLIEDCVFSTNRFYTDGFSALGAGVTGHAVLAAGDLTVRSTTFEGNQGALLWMPHDGTGSLTPHVVVEDCIFRKNSVESGASTAAGTTSGGPGNGASPAYLIAFQDNTLATLDILNCVFVENFVSALSGFGIPAGMVYFDGVDGSETESRLVNCRFAANESASDAFACMLRVLDSDARILNCTLAGNVVNGPVGLDRTVEATDLALLQNSIVYSNSAEFELYVGGAVRNCCYSGPLVIGTDISASINADPMLAADGTLQTGSPCIDTGSANADFDPFLSLFQGPPEFDLAGDAREQDGNGDGTVTIDMGAYEKADPVGGSN